MRSSPGGFQKGDIIGVHIDLSVPQISFTVNGIRVRGYFKDFNLEGMFYPVISLSSKVRYSFPVILAKSKVSVQLLQRSDRLVELQCFEKLPLVLSALDFV